MSQRVSLISLLEDAARRGDELAFVQRRGLRKERWSYGELAATAYQFARELDARGIKSGERVLLWGASGGAWAAAWFGCLARGVIAVPLDELSAPDFVARVQQQVGAKLAVCNEALLAALPVELPRLAFEELRQTIGHHSSLPLPSLSLIDAETQPDDLAQIIFTSGTTAEPKGVCLSHRNLLANLGPLEKGINEYRKWERPFHPIRFLCLLPLSHVFGQFMGIFVPQLLGGEVHFLDTHNPAEIIATIKRERISVIAAVPRQLETLREKLERDYAASGKLEEFQARFAAAEGKHPLVRWWMFRDVHRRLGLKCWAFVAGGATLAAETEQFWMRLGFAVVQGYGMTETASLVSVNHPFKLSRGSIGKTLPGQELKLDSDGTILVRGGNIAAGYWQNGTAHSLSGEKGWLRTGDVGALDAQGNLFFKGRAKDVIVTAAGLNIYPADLEAALNAQPEIKESCVLGFDGNAGPEALAVLILRGSYTDANAAVKRANERLNAAQQMRRWMIWPEPDFPRTATQKVRKPIVKQWVEAQSQNATSPSGANAAQPLHALLVEFSGKALAEVQAMSSAASLGAGLGLDSLGRVSLISALEDRYQIELDEGAVTSETTLQELQAMIDSSQTTYTVPEKGTAAEFKPAANVAMPYPYPSWALSAPVRWLRMFWYYVLILPVTRLLCWTRNVGADSLNELHEPALIVSNHVSMIDHGLILAALPWRLRHRLAIAMDGERLRSWRYPDATQPLFVRVWLKLLYALIVTLFNVFPLPRQSGFRQSFAYAAAAIERGYSVLVFPEGRVTDDGELGAFKSGIGLLAKNLAVPVVPVCIQGLFALKQAHRWWAWPGAVKIFFSSPLRPDVQADEQEFATQLAKQVASLPSVYEDLRSNTISSKAKPWS